MTNVLVTGGAGYIGSHTCKALAQAGYLPVTYDNLTRGHEWAVKWGPLERGDLLDATRLSEVLAMYRPEAVIHLAALAYVGESVSEPAKYYRNNVVGTLNLLDVMRRAGIDKIVFSSTCATYGVPESVPIIEEMSQQPINPYGASKLMIERILSDYADAYGLEVVSLRYFNAAGADPAGEVGEEHDPETHLIPLVLQAAAGARPHVTVFGDDYDTPDGTCIRDYVHVSDLASAHVLAMRALGRGDLRCAYNLGTGRGHSVAEVIDVARRMTGCDIRVVPGPRRPGDPAELFADPTLANDHLGWVPQHALSGMIDSAWCWSRRSLEDSNTARIADKRIAKRETPKYGPSSCQR
jgi:UDP-arabinose 4-epimerase